MRRLTAANAQSFASPRLARTTSLMLAIGALALSLLGAASASAATNDGLAISGTPATSVLAGNMYTFRPTVSDPSHRRLTYSIHNHPGWSTFNKATGELSGSTNRLGVYYGIVISVTDGVSTVALPSYRIYVNPNGGSGSTDSVTISGSPATAVQAGQNYSFQPSAKDSAGKALSFSVTNKPTWASFSIASGGLSGTPTSGETGTYSNVVISASDGTSSAALPAFGVTVTNSATQPPTISGSPTPSVTAGSSYSFTPTATGPSGATLTFAITNKPSWASFSSSTGQLSGTPSSANVGSYSSIGISVSDGTQSASLGAFSINVAAATTAAAGAPVVLYTDVASGPNSGGENNEGAYLSIFGKNFGSTGLGSTVKVYIGGTEVNNYRYLGPSHGRPDVEQITVQVGSLGSPTAGKALPIEVVVNGVDSNTNQTFMVNPGRMLFVSKSGNDATAVAGDITHPYRYVQNGTDGAFDAAQPGDTIVLLGTPLNGAALTSDPTSASSAWTDLYRSYFLKFIYKNGSAATGASGTGPIALIAYPNDDVYIYESYASGASGAISGVDATSYVGGQYVTVADLRIESGGASGGINEQYDGNYWRVVNNEITAVTGSSNPDNKSAGIDGAGYNSFWVGNYVHNINSGASSMTMHGIYIGGAGSYEVAYNWIDTVTDGSGFQAYNDEGTIPTTNDVSFHHNMIYNVVKYGINIADGSTNNIVVYDNVVYGAQYGCLRFNTDTLQGALVYNNTFYNCSTHSGYGVVVDDWGLPGGALVMENNIFYAANNGTYSGGATGLRAGIGTVTNNLFWGGVDGDSWDAHPVNADPAFVSLSTPDFHLQAGSPAIGAGSTSAFSVVTTDYALTPRSSSSMDIGAYTH